jgi:hypothetical protein
MFALKGIQNKEARKGRMREYIATFALSYLASERLQGFHGWREDWDDHVLHITEELIIETDSAAIKAWKSDKAIGDVSQTIDIDVQGF